MSPRIFGVVGWKNSGKTTLTERLVGELVSRGHTVSTVKHAHHAFDIDHEHTDSYRHRMAGAGEVALVSSRRWALMHESREGEEPSLGEILDRLAPCDIVIIEGYKRENHAMIETRRRGARETTPMTAINPNIVAIAADRPVAGESLPVFALDDIAAIADFVEIHTGIRKPVS